MVKWYNVSLSIAFKGNDSYSQWNHRIDNYLYCLPSLSYLRVSSYLFYVISFDSHRNDILFLSECRSQIAIVSNRKFSFEDIIKSMKGDTKHCVYCSLFKCRLDGGNELSELIIIMTGHQMFSFLSNVI